MYLEENLFSTLILGSVFNDYVVFYGDILTVKQLLSVQLLLHMGNDGLRSDESVYSGPMVQKRPKAKLKPNVHPTKHQHLMFIKC